MSAVTVQRKLSSSVCFQQAMAMMDESDEENAPCDCNRNFWADEDSDASECSQSFRRSSVTSITSVTSVDDQTSSKQSNNNNSTSPTGDLSTKTEASTVPCRKHMSRARKMSCPEPRNETRVQWADEKNEALVRENPRKRYERRPSRKLSDPPKPILKQSSFDADYDK